MNLVIVESPTKAKTISKFLPKTYQVESSYGHVRDLPKSKLGIDTEQGFEPQYIIPKKAQKRVTELKKLAKKAERVVLATDEDREGEAIAWHLMQALGLNHEARSMKHGGEELTQTSDIGRQTPTVERIVFHEITKSAIQAALEHPRQLDLALVNAQQARRVLDRLVGYKLSPFLWKKIHRGLSAGRVQSVALRLIVDREEEINRFKPQEYWTITADLRAPAGVFTADLYRVGADTFDKLGIPDGATAETIVRDLDASSYRVAGIERREVRKNPMPPFITSTLQQAAANRLGFSAQKTMYLAQQLYEHGFITYMRTDSVNLSNEALSGAAAWIKANLDARYHLTSPRVFKKKARLAQEAHEAIRPTNPLLPPEEFKAQRKGDSAKDESRLYDLIWRRLIASQLPPAVFESLKIEVVGTGAKEYGLRANGSLLIFDGFLRVLPMKFEERELPQVTDGEALALVKTDSLQHFTEPYPRYNEASLIKTLEKYGIGRPSTYAPIIYLIQERNYVEKNQGRFYPTEIGTLVNKVLTENFADVVDIEFTATMESKLDEVAEGTADWRALLTDFYGPFEKHLAEKYEAVKKSELVPETTDQVCEKCGKPMIIKFGRFGKFMACSGFPDCKNTKSLKDPPKPTGIMCPKCLATEERKEAPGELIERRVSKRGRARGKIFWGCNKYPACDYAVWDDPLKTVPVYPLPEKPKRTRQKNTKREEGAGE